MIKTARKKATRKGVKSSRVALGLFVLGFLILLIAVGKTISLIGGLSKPHSPDTLAITRDYSWDGQANLTIAIQSDKTYVFSLNPSQNMAVILKVADNTHLTVPFNFGRWAAGSIYQLGQSESPKIGAKLLKESVAGALGVPVDGYFILSGSLAQKPFEEIVKTLRQNPLADLTFLGQAKTDLSISEYWRMVWVLRSLRYDKITVLDLGQSTLTSWQLLADGTRVLSFNQPKLDQFIQKYFENSKITDEALSVGILNSTSHPGLAEKAARIVANLGGRVTFTANYPDTLKNSIVLGKDSYSTAYFSKLFAPHPSKMKIDLDLSRADINIFLGEDYFLRYNSR